MGAAPRKEYEERLAARQEAVAALVKKDNTTSTWRLVIFLVAAGMGITLLVSDVFPPWLLALPLVVFGALVVLHERIIQKTASAQQAVKFYERAIDRLDHNWIGHGIQDTDFIPEDHPYGADLDIFGEASLFELLCTARTSAGEQTLARWLAAPADLEKVRQRQQAVEELRLMLNLREDLALLGGGVRSGVRPEVLISWGTKPPVFTGPATGALRALAWAMPLALAVVSGLWVALDTGPLPLLVTLLVLWVVRRQAARRIQQVGGDLHQPGRHLLVLGEVLARLENERFSSPALASLKQSLGSGDEPGSQAIRRLDRLVELFDSMQNAFFALLGALLMWDLHLALRIEAWRAQTGQRIPTWLEAVGAFEALSALAGYAFEHPEDPFPELEEQGPVLEAEDLGHPLIKDDLCVRNSLRLGEEPRILIVSGSNMSGKSTLLRTVGINTALALAGAPVRARRLRLSPLSIGATIRIQDSLLAGRSRFFEEIKRLKQLMDICGEGGERPLIFLLDEVLHGTNSHDRQIGAAALLRQFMERGAVGLLTTHDLALSRSAEELGALIENVHFDDRLEDGELIFDYTLKPGIVQKSNAIDLMRAVGLKL